MGPSLMISILLISIFFHVLSTPLQDNPEVGYKVGQIKNYKKIREFQASALYEVQCQKLDDGRPIKLLDLHGSHFQAGYAYSKLMAKQIFETYKAFFHAALDTQLEIKLMQKFLDWQYQMYVGKQLPIQFNQELKGISKGGRQHGYHYLRAYFERVLVISSYPGSLQNDIISVLADQFLKSVLRIKREKVESFYQDSYLKIVHILKKFFRKVAINCSFFATWGSRTLNKDLYTMRNLDWLENTGVNQNKLVTVWNINGEIPHLTLGFPGVLGALTGMSKSGLTVHEAGLSSHHSTELGFQWTLRMRFIMMRSNNLAEAKKIWQQTKNSLGMNFMIASSKDIFSGHPALAMQTMRSYTAYFYDNDSRQNNTKFVDPNTKKQYIAGHSMPEVLFRTNHAYDPIIIKHLRKAHIPEDDDSMIRYQLLNTAFNWYREQNRLVGALEAINITSILGDKGSQSFLNCENNYRGANVISVTYQPSELKMWAAFQYGYQNTFRSACCGVYVQFDMKKWFI